MPARSGCGHHEAVSYRICCDRRVREVTGPVRRRDLARLAVDVGRRVSAGQNAGQSPSESGSVAEVRAIAASLRELEGRVGPVHVARSVATHLRFVEELSADATSADCRELTRVASETAELAGWLAFDTGDLTDSERHYRHALTLAQNASDPALAAWAMGNLGRAMTSAGRGQEALNLFESAQRLATGIRAPRLASWLSAAKAWDHASLGERQQCSEALEAAARHLEEPDDNSFPWLGFYGYSQLDKWTGRCQLMFGQDGFAARSFRTSLRLLPSCLVRERAATLADLADAYTHVGDVDSACECLHDAHALSAPTGSIRIEGRIRQVRLSLRRWSGTSPVRDLDEFLRQD